MLRFKIYSGLFNLFPNILSNTLQLIDLNKFISLSVSFYYSQHFSLFQGATDFFAQPNPFPPFHPVVGIFKT